MSGSGRLDTPADGWKRHIVSTTFIGSPNILEAVANGIAMCRSSVLLCGNRTQSSTGNKHLMMLSHTFVLALKRRILSSPPSKYEKATITIAGSEYSLASLHWTHQCYYKLIHYISLWLPCLCENVCSCCRTYLDSLTYSVPSKTLKYPRTVLAVVGIVLSDLIGFDVGEYQVNRASFTRECTLFLWDWFLNSIV